MARGEVHRKKSVLYTLLGAFQMEGYEVLEIHRNRFSVRRSGSDFRVTVKFCEDKRFGVERIYPNGSAMISVEKNGAEAIATCQRLGLISSQSLFLMTGGCRE